MVFLLCAAGQAAALSLQWTRTYNAPANRADGIQSVAAGPDGSAVAAGFISDSSSQTALFVRKYRADGSVAWTRTAPAPSAASAVAVAADGSVVAAGRSSADTLVRKYSPTGDLVWKKVFNVYSGGKDGAAGVGILKDGGVVVSGNGPAGWLLRLTSAGSLAYVAGVPDRLHGLAVAGDGSVYVAGLQTGAASRIQLRKFSPTGAPAWKRTLTHVGWGVGDVAVTKGGSVYLTNVYWSDYPANTRGTVLLARYDAAGALKWKRTVPSYLEAEEWDGPGLATGPDAVWVTGVGSARDFFLRKYSPAGALIASRTVPGRPAGSDAAVSADGSVYAAGTFLPPPYGSTYPDVWIGRWR